jgi:hypothetical protein
LAFVAVVDDEGRVASLHVDDAYSVDLARAGAVKVFLTTS